MSIFSSLLLSLAPGSSLPSSGGWSSIIMETLKRNTCQRIRCLHLSHRSFLSHYLNYLTTLTILTLTYPTADLHIAIDMFCNQHLSPLPGSKQLDALRLANQQLCFCLPFQVAIPTKVLLSNKQTQWNRMQLMQLFPHIGADPRPQIPLLRIL